MAIDFTLTPELEEIRVRVRTFIDDGGQARRGRASATPTSSTASEYITHPARACASKAQEAGPLAAAHAQGVGRHGARPRRAGHGAGRGGQDPLRARGSSTARRPTRATCTRCCTGRTDEQKEKYLRPLCEGTAMSCFAMTEPEVAGSDPTLIQTTRRTRTATSG